MSVNRKKRTEDAKDAFQRFVEWVKKIPEKSTWEVEVKSECVPVVAMCICLGRKEVTGKTLKFFCKEESLKRILGLHEKLKNLDVKRNEVKLEVEYDSSFLGKNDEKIVLKRKKLNLRS